jgi:hypothetical protein
MARVWRMLLKKRKKCALKEYGAFVMPELLCFSIAYALKEMKSEHLSRTEEFNNYNEIAKAAKHLSNLLKNTELDKPVYQWYSQDDISIALGGMKSDRCEGHFCLIHDLNVVDKKYGVYKNLEGCLDDEPLENFDENRYRYSRIAENTHDWFQNHVVSKKQAKVSSIIIGLEKDATKLTKRALTRKKFLEKPKSTSEITVFVRVLYLTYWKDAFDGPMNGTFASLCNVVIEGANIDDQTIRYALESYR